jgi:ADP-heptose:LPS heptosyltransferase
MFKYLFFLIKSLFYFFFNFFCTEKIQYLKESIVVIKLDGIGDYILFRNFLSEIKKDKKYKDANITLIGNVAFKELAEVLEKKIVDHFIWIDKKKFLFNLIYRFKILKNLNKFSYKLLLHPTFSRDFFVSDWISNFITSKKKISFFGDCSNQLFHAKKISDGYYNYLIKHNKLNKFDFFKYKNFFEIFLEKKIKIQRTFIKKNHLSNYYKFRNYISFFVTAGAMNRMYSLKNFILLAGLIENNYKYKIIFLGGNENNLAQNFNNNNYVNLINKTNLNQLTEIIRNSKLLISNDTCAHHISAAVNTDCIVLGTGLHHGRFLPYPKSFNVIHESIVSKNSSTNFSKNINNINPSQIMRIVKKILKK